MIGHELTLFVSITSGPAHSSLREALRGTWLRTCQDSPVCDYRFFIDVVESNVTAALSLENSTFHDVVVRGPWCPMMIDRHHHLINYGNVMWNSSTDERLLPDYTLRMMYKIDWKVCFTKWAKLNNRLTSFLVFVEDDSFICTGNLLHQLTILNRLVWNDINAQAPGDGRAPPLRIGMPAWHGGFDDSSTLMSRVVAEAFADHYPEPGFNCSEMADVVDRKQQNWLTWGNSWMTNRCNWREKLQDVFNISVVSPAIHKVELHCGVEHPPTLAPVLAASANDTGRNGTSNDTITATRNDTRGLFEAIDCATRPRRPASDRRLSAVLPCPSHGMIMHHHRAGEVLVKDDNVARMCDYMLFIDKVKDAEIMHVLWNKSTADPPTYHNFSTVLTHDYHEGWPLLRQSLDNKEHECANETRPEIFKACMAWRRDRQRVR